MQDTAEEREGYVPTYVSHESQANGPESAVCVNCRSKLPDLYQKQVSLLGQGTVGVQLTA
jgi:hypothetical protein